MIARIGRLISMITSDLFTPKVVLNLKYTDEVARKPSTPKLFLDSRFDSKCCRAKRRTSSFSSLPDDAVSADVEGATS